MSKRRPSGTILPWLLLFMFTALLRAAAHDTNLLARLEPVPPFPDLQAVARTDAISLDGFICSNNPGLEVGDTLTALITLHQKGNHHTQWLVYFEVVADRAVKASGPAKPMVLYSPTGRRFEFAHAPATFRVRTIGPYTDSGSFWGDPVPRDKSALDTVNKGFLRLGLDRGAAAIYRVNRAKANTSATNFNMWASFRPPATNDLAKNQMLAAQFHVTADEEQAVACWFPALFSYFDAVGQTPGLESIMLKIARLPSLWSIVKSHGIKAWMGVNEEDIRPLTLPAGWDLPGQAPVYTLPMSVTLNGQPVVFSTLLITDPNPSFLGCGGIIGFLAQDPGDDENYLTLRILSTRKGK